MRLLLILAATLAAQTTLAAQDPPVPSQDVEVVTAPVEVDGVVLFRVRGVSSLPAAERAQLIRQRIVDLARNAAVPVSAIEVVERPGLSLVQAAGSQIVGLADADAAFEQIGRADLAQAHRDRIREAVTTYRAARDPSVIWADVLRVVVATVLVVAALWILMRVLEPLRALVARRLHARLDPVRADVSSEQKRATLTWQALRGVFLAVRATVVLFILLFYLGYVLGQFPWTAGASHQLLGFAAAPFTMLATGFVDNLPNLIFLAVLFLALRLSLKLLRLFFDGVAQGAITLHNFEPAWAEPTYTIVRVAVIVLALAIAYPYIPGSGSDAFKGISIFVGIVFSLGSSSAIANVIAGYALIYRRAFKVGDRVKIGDGFGDVIDMGLQVTHIRSIKNEELIIPNSQILVTSVQNFSSLATRLGLILHSEVTIGYDTEWRQVEGMLLEAAKRTDGLQTEPAPYVLIKELGDFAVRYEINAYCPTPATMHLVYTALHRHILDVFNEHGVQIMSPAYESDPDTPKVVPRAASA